MASLNFKVFYHRRPNLRGSARPSADGQPTASAMIGTVLLTSHAMAGGFWVQMADGSSTSLMNS